MRLLNDGKVLLSAALVFLTTISARGFPVTAIERDFALTVWETEDGLPNNDVHSITGDHNGFLWVGTASGLVRFDGRGFLRPGGGDEGFYEASTVYSVVESQPGEIVFVHDLDARNDLMICGSNGTREHPVNAVLPPGQRILSVFRESEGVLWVLCSDRTWVRWHAGGVETFPTRVAISSSQPASMVVADGKVLLARGDGVEAYQDGRLEPLTEVGGGQVVLTKAAAGGAWIASLQHLYRWNNGVLTKKDPPVQADQSWPPQLMLETADGALWMAFWNAGLFRWDGSRLTQISTLHRTLRCLFEDRERNLWVGSADSGLNRIRRSTFALWAPEVADTIGSVCEDRDGNRWLANATGVWQLQEGRAVRAGNFPEWPSFANAVCVDQDGALWIGGANRIYRRRPGIDESPVVMPPGVIKHAYAIYCARDGVVWAGCESGPLLRYAKDGTAISFGPKEGYDGSFAQVFGEDADGKLWTGTRSGDLFYLADGRFHRVQTPLNDSGTGILTITPGTNKSLWLGTRGSGFLRLKDGVFRTVDKRFGLPDGLIAQTLEDDGNFWVGSSNSIFNVAIDDLDACADGRMKLLRPVRFGRSDGIQGFFATGQRQPCAFKSTDGTMWFVGRKGIVTFDPANLQQSPGAAESFIDAAVAEDSILAAGGSILSTNNRLEFRFTSPTFVAPDDMRFRYRLVGFEKSWNESEGQRLALYPRLSPGAYSFEVTASSRDKRWNPQPATFHFTVKPVWWEWWWLRIVALLFLGGCLAWGIRTMSNRRIRRKLERLRQEQKIEHERSRIARDLHDGIGAELTKLGWLAGDLKAGVAGSPGLHDRSSSLCKGIWDLARDLDAAVWAVSPKHDTMTSLLAYLCEFTGEHFARTPIRCRVFTPDSLPAGPLPPHVRNQVFMATKEALNNALKHSNATEVHLKISYENEILNVEVSDNGQGFDVAEAKSGPRHGLKNLEERMREIKGVAEVSSDSNGSQVRLIIPLAP